MTLARCGVLLSVISLLAASPVECQAQRLQSDRHRNGNRIREAFVPVVEPVRKSTVRVLVDGVQVALGVVVSKKGLVLTKASEIRSNAVCEFMDGNRRDATLIGVESQFDLGMLRLSKIKADETFDAIELTEPSPEAIGSFVATPGIKRLPEAIGVVSSPARRIPRARGILGVLVEMSDQGPVIGEVLPGSGAEKAGLKVGDWIIKIGGKATPVRESVSELLRSYRPGDSVRLVIGRGEERLQVEATIGQPNRGLSGRRSFENQLSNQLSQRRAGFDEVFVHDSMLRTSQCGGLLVDLDGRPLGLNIARAGRTACFAIPTRSLIPLLPELASGRLAPPIPQSSAPEPPPLPEPSTNRRP